MAIDWHETPFSTGSAGRAKKSETRNETRLCLLSAANITRVCLLLSAARSQHLDKERNHGQSKEDRKRHFFKGVWVTKNVTQDELTSQDFTPKSRADWPTPHIHVPLGPTAFAKMPSVICEIELRSPALIGQPHQPMLPLGLPSRRRYASLYVNGEITRTLT